MYVHYVGGVLLDWKSDTDIYSTLLQRLIDEPVKVIFFKLVTTIVVVYIGFNTQDVCVAIGQLMSSLKLDKKARSALIS